MWGSVSCTLCFAVFKLMRTSVLYPGFAVLRFDVGGSPRLPEAPRIKEQLFFDPDGLGRALLAIPGRILALILVPPGSLGLFGLLGLLGLLGFLGFLC